MSCMENAKKPAVFFQISLKSLSKYLVAQNGAFERQIAAILTHRRHFTCRTLNLNSLSFLASLVTSTGSTNLAVLRGIYSKTSGLLSNPNYLVTQNGACERQVAAILKITGSYPQRRIQISELPEHCEGFSCNIHWPT